MIDAMPNDAMPNDAMPNDALPDRVMTHASPRWSFAWRRSLFLMGWWQPLLGLIGIVILGLLAQGRDPIAQMIGYSAVAAVGGLVGGIQGAYAFAPGDEPALELLLASPRPRWLLLVERLIVIFVMNAVVVLIGVLIFTAINPDGETAADQLVRWLPTFILLTGLGMLIGLTSKRSSYGALLIILLDGAMLFGGVALLMRFSWAWAILLFPPLGVLSPEQWIVNRVVLIVIGAVCVALAFRIASNDEQLLRAIDE